MREEKIDLCIIPARGGSVGVPRKNVANLAGYPLIHWTIRAALASNCFERVIVSTDDYQIASEAQKAGAEVPFIRPASLATSTAPSSYVIEHALQHFPEVLTFGLLQPTSPFRSAAHIGEAVSSFRMAEALSLVSVQKAKPVAWCFQGIDGYLVRQSEAEVISRRQDAAETYSLNGAIYLCETGSFQRNSGIPLPGAKYYVMGGIDSIDIDDWEDFALASAIADSRLRTIDQL